MLMLHVSCPARTYIHTNERTQLRFARMAASRSMATKQQSACYERGQKQHKNYVDLYLRTPNLRTSTVVVSDEIAGDAGGEKTRTPMMIVVSQQKSAVPVHLFLRGMVSLHSFYRIILIYAIICYTTIGPVTVRTPTSLVSSRLTGFIFLT